MVHPGPYTRFIGLKRSGREPAHSRVFSDKDKMLKLSLNLPIGFVLKLRVVLHVRGCTTNGSHTSYLEQNHKPGTAEVYLTTVRGQAITYLLTYLLHGTVLEKLTGSAASQEIPRIFRTRKFITVLTSVRHLSLSYANSVQSSQHPPTSWRSFLILSSHLRLVCTAFNSEIRFSMSLMSWNF